MATVNLERPPHLDGSSMSNERLRQYLNRMVEALAYALGHLDSQNIREGGLTTASVSGLDSKIARAAQAEVGKVKIGAAQVQDLEAQVARIVTAKIGTLDVDWASIKKLEAAILEVVGSASIDFAKIKDLITDNQIITKGEAGELYIADLAVTEGNMVRLALGQLLLKGEDGRFYEIFVDDDGDVASRAADVAGALEDDSVDGGEKLIDGSITAAKLNARDIFADSALIRELMAANIDVDTLFAREATINAITTMDLLANEQLRVTVSGYDALNASIRAWFDFGAEGVLGIGRSDKPYRATLSYEELAFWYKTTKTLSLKGDVSTMPNLVVEHSFTLGDMRGVADEDGVSWV